MRHSTWKKLTALIVCALLLVGSIGISTVADGEPELWVGGVQVTEANASDILGNGNVSFDFDTNTLTFDGYHELGVYNDAMIYATGMDLTINASGNASFENWEGEAFYGVYVDGGDLTINGDLLIYVLGYDCFYGIYSTKGDVTVNGELSVEGFYRSAITCYDGGIEINADFSYAGFADEYVLDANGPVAVTGKVNIVSYDGSCNGIRSTSGGIVCGDDVTISASAVAMLSKGENAGIIIDGNATVSNVGNTQNGVLVSTGAISVNGDLTVTEGYGLCVIQAKDDIIVDGNVDIDAQYSDSSYSQLVHAMSTDGSIDVAGNLKIRSCGSGAFAKNTLNIDGDAELHFGLHKLQEYGLKADAGSLSIGGDLTSDGIAQEVVSGLTIDIVGNVKINAAYEQYEPETAKAFIDPTDCYAVRADDSVNVLGTLEITANSNYGVPAYGPEYGVVAGGTINIAAKWDVTANRVALLAADGIVKPANFGVTTPEGGKIVELADGATVTEADGTTVAAHAVIDEVETITITLDPCNDGESEAITIEIPAGGTIDEFPTVTYTGHKFIGWFTEAAASAFTAGTGTEVTTETVFNEDTTIYAHWYMPGDINGDGKVNNKDVTRLLKYLAGDDVDVVAAALDVNGDSKVNNKDVTRLLKHLAGDEVEIF